jgi:hypothetical protein
MRTRRSAILPSTPPGHVPWSPRPDVQLFNTAVGAGCVLYSGGFTDSERLRATGKLVARSLSEAVGLIDA